MSVFRVEKNKNGYLVRTRARKGHGHPGSILTNAMVHYWESKYSCCCFRKSGKRQKIQNIILPHIFAEPDAESKSAYLDRLNREIYLKDIYERYDIKDEGGMEELTKVLASSVGSLSNPQRI